MLTQEKSARNTKAQGSHPGLKLDTACISNHKCQITDAPIRREYLAKRKSGESSELGKAQCWQRSKLQGKLFGLIGMIAMHYR